ncbi:unnamed protein product [Calypogeia fissa]
MNSSTRVEHSVTLGAKDQSVWNYEGIDLFVLLPIDSRDSTPAESLSPWAGSDAPRPIQAYAHDSTLEPSPEDVLEEVSILRRAIRDSERIQLENPPWEDFRARSHIVELATVRSFLSGEWDELDREVVRFECGAPAQSARWEQIRGQGQQLPGRVESRKSVPGVAVRRFIRRFVSPFAFQTVEPRYLNNSAQVSSGSRRVREWNDQAEERSSEDDHDKVCDMEGQCTRCEKGVSSSGIVVTGCRCLAVNQNIGELRTVTQEELVEQSKDRSRRVEALYSCNENRSWSPQVDDYFWVPVDHTGRDPDRPRTGCTERSTDVGEELIQEQDCSNMPSSNVSQKDVVGRILQLERNGNPGLNTLSPSKCPEIENYDVSDILAACQLVKMSAFDCRKGCFREQEVSPTKGCDVNNLEFRSESNEDMPSNVVDVRQSCGSLELPDIDVSNTRNCLQPVVGKLDLSPWSDEDRYIPRIARRARGRLRGSQFSTRIDFGNTEVDEDSDCEVAQRPHKRRQFRSTQELLMA